MQGYTDTPVTTIENDSLEVNVYIDSLSEFILECSTPMTIAIQGDWGSGKTSMMNMVRQHVQSQVVPIWFNTWQYSQFDMASYLSISLLTDFLDKIGAEQETKSLLNAVASSAKMFGKAAAVIATEQILGETMAGNLNDKFSATEQQNMAKSLESLRDNIQKAVAKKLQMNKKDRIVVFVDDLDRLAPEKAVELLEVLKIFMDVSNCVFILAVDYAVITQGLIKKFGNQVGHSKGKSFFDKIIQLPFAMPTAQYNITSYIKNLLTNMNISCGEDEIDTYREVVDFSIGCNPRSLKRIFNSFILLNKVAAKRGLFNEDGIEVKDKQRVLFATLCLQMAFQELYEHMIKNRHDLDAEFFDGMRDLERLKTDGQLESIRKVILDKDDANFGRIADFMELFYSCLQLDEDYDHLSDIELENLKSILSFSAITANAREDVQQVRLASGKGENYVGFWTQFLESIKGRSLLFQKNKPRTSGSMSSSSDGVTYELVAQKKRALCVITINYSDKRDDFFDELVKFKSQIDFKASKESRTWQWIQNEQKKELVILSEQKGLNVSDVEQWQKINEFLISEINLMHKTLEPYFEKICQPLNNKK